MTGILLAPLLGSYLSSMPVVLVSLVLRNLVAQYRSSDYDELYFAFLHSVEAIRIPYS